MRLTMFRTKLLLLGAVFLILIITMGGLALWVAKEMSYHLQRSRLSNAVHGDTLRLSAQIQTLFKQLIDIVLTGDLADQFETRSVQLGYGSNTRRHPLGDCLGGRVGRRQG